ncbi:uncharacterized protein L201_002092 [Kwoniella dendrophila CBS 6074]|uniref:Uncharacterized protein n=1 Tax=Kwoniella dendrophila CBS 6074 TaxID=1295534 RepID=A0AAX4JP92_9TREE
MADKESYNLFIDEEKGKHPFSRYQSWEHYVNSRVNDDKSPIDSNTLHALWAGRLTSIIRSNSTFGNEERDKDLRTIMKFKIASEKSKDRLVELGWKYGSEFPPDIGYSEDQSSPNLSEFIQYPEETEKTMVKELSYTLVTSIQQSQ